MRSEERLETNLPFFEYLPSEEERTKIEQNYEQYEDNGRIRFVTPPHILKEEKQKNIEDLRTDLEKARTINELRSIILTLINNQ